MVANLVRKDFLLVKKMAAAFLAVSILVPIILMVNAAQMAGIEIISCLYMVILTEILFMQSVAAEEEKSPKAVALLCAAPYSRKSYIINLLWRKSCYLLSYRSRLSSVQFLECYGSSDGLFDQYCALRHIYSDYDQIRGYKRTACDFCCYIACFNGTYFSCTLISPRFASYHRVSARFVKSYDCNCCRHFRRCNIYAVYDLVYPYLFPEGAVNIFTD